MELRKESVFNRLFFYNIMKINLEKERVINLILNRNCNMNCIYCIQNNQAYSNNDRLPIEELCSYFPKYSKFLVRFYGGEPLLDFDYMIEFAKYLKEYNNQSKFSVITNGSLLTVEMAKILNELDFQVIISHDGINYSKLRNREDVLNTNGQAIACLNNLCFKSTITSLNWDYYAIWEYFDDFRVKMNIKKPKISFTPLKDISGYIPDWLYVYNNKDFEKMLDRVMIDLKKDILNNNFDSYVFSHYSSIIGRIYMTECFNEVITPCKSIDRRLSFDTKGNIYNCHNSYIPCGNMANLQFTPLQGDFNECANCDIKKYCNGECPLMTPYSHKYYCYYMYQELSRVINMLSDLTKENINSE